MAGSPPIRARPWRLKRFLHRAAGEVSRGARRRGRPAYAVKRPLPPAPPGPPPPLGGGGAMALALALLAAPALAQTDNNLHGRLELQDAGQFASAGSVQAALGEPAANDSLGNLRLAWEPTWGDWSLQVHYLISAEDGPDVALAHLERGLIHEPPSTWLNLTDTFESHGALVASQSIDRLAVAYTTSQWVVRVGRQAITWGSGL